MTAGDAAVAEGFAAGKLKPESYNGSACWM